MSRAQRQSALLLQEIDNWILFILFTELFHSYLLMNDAIDLCYIRTCAKKQRDMISGLLTLLTIDVKAVTHICLIVFHGYHLSVDAQLS